MGGGIKSGKTTTIINGRIIYIFYVEWEAIILLGKIPHSVSADYVNSLLTSKWYK